MLKPRFIHHRRSKELLRDRCSGARLRPRRRRTSTCRGCARRRADGYLTTGIAYAWHPHRDTWYSAPMCQLNLWMPVYEISPATRWPSTRRTSPRRCRTTPHDYNYYEWNSKYRAQRRPEIGSDDRPLPGPTVEVDISDPLVLVTPIGGLLEFSGQHLHSSVPNHSGRTRFSIDFRTVHVADIEGGAVGAERRRQLHGVVDPRLRAGERPGADARARRRALPRRYGAPRRPGLRRRR